MLAGKTKKTHKKAIRKPKFQADLAPVEDNIVRSLKQELQISSNSDFMTEAVALFKWAVSERKCGRKIISESATGERQVLVLSRLERVAPESALPRVSVDWSEAELRSLAHLSASEPAPPTDALVRAMSITVRG